MEIKGESTLLNVRKTALLLDVHPNTLRNWTNQGILPCYTVNTRGDRRFRLSDIEDFLRKHRRLEAQPERSPIGYEIGPEPGPRLEPVPDDFSANPSEGYDAQSAEDEQTVYQSSSTR